MMKRLLLRHLQTISDCLMPVIKKLPSYIEATGSHNPLFDLTFTQQESGQPAPRRSPEHLSS